MVTPLYHARLHLVRGPKALEIVFSQKSNYVSGVVEKGHLTWDDFVATHIASP